MKALRGLGIAVLTIALASAWGVRVDGDQRGNGGVRR